MMKFANLFYYSAYVLYYSLGQGLCPVNFFTGHGQIWTRVQEWTRVQDPTCPVKKFTGHKPGLKNKTYTILISV